jgi:PKD repeat protein
MKKILITFTVILFTGFLEIMAQPYDTIDFRSGLSLRISLMPGANWGDVDGDGDFDIAVGTRYTDSYGVIIFRNDGSNSFDPYDFNFWDTERSFTSPRLEFRDFDNDNIPELFASGRYLKDPTDNRNEGSAVAIYKYSGDAITTFFLHEVGGEIVESCGCADFDKDGDLDFHFGGKVFQNTDGEFTYIHHHKSEYPDIIWSDDEPLYKSADIDKNGAPDSLGFDKVYVNRLDTADFKKPSIPVLDHEESIIGNNEALFWWSPSTDPDSHADSITYNLSIGTRSGGSNVLSPSSDLSTGLKRTSNRGNMGLYNMPVRITNLETGLRYYWSVQSVDKDGLSSEFSEERSFLYSAFQLEDGNRGDSRISGICLPVDIDGDGDLEFFSGAFMPLLFWYDYDNLRPHITDTTYVVDYYLDSVENSFVNHAALADFDNDGNIDIIARDNLYSGSDMGSSLSHIYRNNGNSTFDRLELPVNSLEGSVLSSNASVNDFNNDGYQDILLLSQNYTYLLENQRNFQFEVLDSLQIIAVDSGFAAWSDFDNDLDQDLFISGVDNYGNNISRLYRNDDSDFIEVTNNIIALANGSADWGDYDNDGDMDLLVTGNDNSGLPITRVYQNNQSQFKQINTDFIGVGYSRYIHPTYGDLDPKEQRSFGMWGDFDNDGFLDIIIHGADQLDEMVSELYRNNGIGGFELLPCGFRTCRAGSLMIGDIYDHDGDLDIIFTGQSGADQFTEGADRTSSYRNLYGQNVSPAPPVNLQADVNGFDAVFTWDPGTDQESDDHLTYNIRIGTSPGGIDILPPMSDPNTGKRLIVENGNTGLSTSWRIKDLSIGDYYWSVQSVDQSFNGGSWAPEQSFTVTNLQADFSADTVCLGTETNFTDLTFSSTEPVISWEWDFGDGTETSSEINPGYTYSSDGEFDVSLRVNTASEESLVTKTVVVKPTVSPGFTASEVCAGVATTFVNTSFTNGLTVNSWRWRYGDGSPDYMGQDSPSHPYTAGSYDVILEVVAENGCFNADTNEVFVGKVPSINLSTHGALDFCAGDSVILSAESYPNFEYEWRFNNVPILNATDSVLVVYISGDYYANITNLIGHCTIPSQEYSISAHPLPPVPEITSENYVMGECPSEDPVILSIQNPSDEMNYQWKHNGKSIQGEVLEYLSGYLNEGNYSIEAERNGCTSESEFFSVEYGDIPEKPDLYVVGPNVWYLACSNDTAQSYRWYYNDQQIPGETSYLYVAGNKLGKYQVSISDGGACYASSDPVWIPLSTGIENQFWESLRIYPNPTPGVFTIEMDNPIIGDLMVNIHSETGYKVLSIRFHKETSHFRSEVDLSSQPAGVYMIGLFLDKNQTTRKLLVE